MEDWRRYRDIRLRALKESPTAFGSTYEVEAQFADQQWRDRLRRRTQFVANSGDHAIGTVGARVTDTPGTAELISMWVAPAWRGRGIGARLVEEVVGWAAAQALSEVHLWVADGNAAAERLYARRGFRRTGVSQLVDEERPERGIEHAMNRRLDRRP